MVCGFGGTHVDIHMDWITIKLIYNFRQGTQKGVYEITNPLEPIE